MIEQELREGETVEFKESWSERALEDLAAFANHKGGAVWVGIRDDGTVNGFQAGDGRLQTIVNQIVDVLGVHPALEWRTRDGKQVLVIEVPPAAGLVPCKGRYLTRVGSTNRDMTQDQMARLVLDRSGLSWDALASDATTEMVDPEAVRDFIRAARTRLPSVREDDPVERVLANLELLTGDRLTRGGALLFARSPQRLFPLARLRVGRFKGHTIIDDRTAGGNLFNQLDGAMQAFRVYLQVRYEFPGEGTGLDALRRREIWEYPLDALREAIVNALIHRDYMDLADIQVRVYDDRIDIWSPGGLPPGISVDDLRREGHLSRPRNPHLAQVFHYAELVEHWGTGTTRMIAACRAQGLPDAEFSEGSGGFHVIFRKDPYTPEQLRALGLNERQVQAVNYLRGQGGLSNSEYQRLVGVSKRTASRELEDLVGRGIVQRQGQTGRGTRYVLARSERGQTGHNGATMGPNDSPEGEGV